MVFEAFWNDLRGTAELLGTNVGFVIGLVQFIGGLLVIYFIIAIVRFFMQRKQNKMIKEMRDDIKLIKTRLNKKK